MLSGGAGAWLYNLMNAFTLACSSGSKQPTDPVATVNPINEFLGRMNAREKFFITRMQQLADNEALLSSDAKIAPVQVALKQPTDIKLTVDEKSLAKNDVVAAMILESLNEMKGTKEKLAQLEKEYKANDKNKLLAMSVLNREIAFQNMLLVNNVRMALLVWRAMEDVVAIQTAENAADVLLYRKIEKDDHILELFLSESEQAITRCENNYKPLIGQSSKNVVAADAKNSAAAIPSPNFNPMLWLVEEINRQINSMVSLREDLRSTSNMLEEKRTNTRPVDVAGFLRGHQVAMSATVSKKAQEYKPDVMQKMINSCQAEMNVLRGKLAEQYLLTGDASKRKEAYEEIGRLSTNLVMCYRSLLLDMQLMLTEWRVSKDVGEKLLMGLSPQKLKSDLQELVDRKLFSSYAVDIKYLVDVFNTVRRDVEKCMADMKQYVNHDLQDDDMSLDLGADEVNAVPLTSFRGAAALK